MASEQDPFVESAENGYARTPASIAVGKTAAGCDRDLINENEDDQMEAFGYRRSRFRTAISVVLSVLTVGLLQLVFRWRRHWDVMLTCVRCSLAEANYVILKNLYDQRFVERVREHVIRASDMQNAKWLPVCSSVAKTSTNDKENVDGATSIRCRYFVNKRAKYVWNSARRTFVRLRGPEDGQSCSYFHQVIGLSDEQRKQGFKLYGENVISVHVTPVLKLFFSQTLNPFYVFQAFCVCLWIVDGYYVFAGCITSVTLISLAVQTYETRSTQRALKHTISGTGPSIVYRADRKEYTKIDSTGLVPGDVIEIQRQGCVMQCDAVLVNGNCVVNEGMLTGECVPVTKTAIPNVSRSESSRTSAAATSTFNVKEHSRHVLFCGTRVILTRHCGQSRVRAVVIRTGFSTARGELIRSILFPKPVDFKFARDSIKFIMILACVALVGMIYTVIVMVEKGEEPKHIIVRTLDMIIITVPPALPAIMTVGTLFARRRLRCQEIFCINPRCINMCGAVNVFCLDKTGTMTEEGVDVWGVVPVRDRKFRNVEKTVKELPEEDPLVVAMATCHSLSVIDGELCGDPIDLQMFETTGWELQELGDDGGHYDDFVPAVVRPRKPKTDRCANNNEVPYEVGIVRQFAFTSKLQRMSVITRQLAGKCFDLYVKGAPEMIASLSLPDSVPVDFQQVLDGYTKLGFRVLALASGNLNNINAVRIHRVERDEIENQLTFLGLLIFKNRLKQKTRSVIRSLQQAKIRPVMVTGDNMLTAISVAREAGLVQSTDRLIVLTASLNENEQQQQLSIELDPVADDRWQVRDDVVNAIDDDACHGNETQEHRTERKGRNKASCGMKTSVAIDVTPRRSKRNVIVTGSTWALLYKFRLDIIQQLVRLGTIFARFSPEQKQQLVECLQKTGFYVGMCGDGANDCGALKTAHAGISLSEAEASVAAPFTSRLPDITCVHDLIREGRAALVTSYGVFKYMACYSLTQFTSVCILYWVDSNLTDLTFLYIDIVITVLGISFCYTEAYTDIVPRPPDVSLLGITPLLSIFGQLMTNMAFQIAAWKYTMQQPWYEPQLAYNDVSHDTTAVFTVSAFQYIWMAIIYSVGAPYRKNIFTNKLFVVAIFACIVSTLYIGIVPCSYLEEQAELKPSPSILFRLCLVGIAAMNFTIGYLVEMYILAPACRYLRDKRDVIKAQLQRGKSRPRFLRGCNCRKSLVDRNQMVDDDLQSMFNLSKLEVELFHPETQSRADELTDYDRLYSEATGFVDRSSYMKSTADKVFVRT